MYKSAEQITIGKFDILATYTYARELLDGRDDADVRRLVMVAAVGGANYRRRKGTAPEPRTEKDEKRESTITAEAFDHQVADKMGAFFADTFLPTMRRLVGAGFSYAEVKRLVKIPTTWGAKITAVEFEERTGKTLDKR
jgi:hypothetical protein